MAHRPTRVATRRSALGLSLLLVLSALALPAVAQDATTDRSYTATVSPTRVCSGVESAYTLTLTNTSSQQRLGSARIAVPATVSGVDDLAVDVSRQRGPQSTPIVSYDDGTGLISLDGLSTAPGATATVTFTATASGPGDTAVFTTQAKQANDFNSTSDAANELVLVGDQPTTTIVSCGTLKFVEQPGDTSVGVAIPGADGRAGPRVAIVDDEGDVITGASATITIARTDDGSLAGTKTQTTTDGVAIFDDLTIDEAGVYTLTASADGFLDVESEGFEVFAFGDTCLVGEECTTTLNDDKNGSTLLTGTAFGGTGALLGNSVSQAGDIQACGAVDGNGDPVEYDLADYSYLPNQVTIGGTNLADKLVEFTVSKQYDQQQANNGVSFYQVCAEPLAPFTEFSTFVDIFGNIVVNPADATNIAKLVALGFDPAEFQSSGFLPDCASADDTPCVESRVKRGGGPVITARWGSRWTMR
jgi:hypothetical protein